MTGMRSFIFLTVALFFCGFSSFSQKARYQSDIVYRLTQHVTWPEKSLNFKFVIGIVGSTEDFESFQELALEKGLFQNNPIEVRYFECTDSIEDCHLLYISEECKIEMARIVKKTKNEPVLIVSGKKGYGDLGSIINFVDTDEKLKFEFNQQQALKRGLKISDQLRDIAIII